jgi:hypothetical protein
MFMKYFDTEVRKAKAISEAWEGSPVLSLLDAAISSLEVDGFMAEFGVFSGTTVNFVATRMPERTIYGFDWFNGLPENWREDFDRGLFAVNKDHLLFRSNVKIYDGLFADTIPVFKQDVSGPASFINIDSDLYASCKTVLDGLDDRIVDGTILHFDEFHGYPEYREHEFKAFHEYIARTGKKYQYLYWNPEHEQVVVRMGGK